MLPQGCTRGDVVIVCVCLDLCCTGSVRLSRSLIMLDVSMTAYHE